MSGAGHHLHYYLVGGSGGGDDPSRYHMQAMKSLHELDVASGSKRPAADGDKLFLFPFQCPICKHTLCTEKAVEGHMRGHWERGWRGMELPRPPNDGELGADGRLHGYAYDRCGLRVSHSGKRGCSWLSKKELTEAAATPEAPRPVVFEFDLNEPAAEAGEEEQEE